MDKKLYQTCAVAASIFFPSSLDSIAQSTNSQSANIVLSAAPARRFGSPAIAIEWITPESNTNRVAQYIVEKSVDLISWTTNSVIYNPGRTNKIVDLLGNERKFYRIRAEYER